MNKKIIVIAGYLASGKSTFALRLSKELNIPYFIKDTFKSAICTGIPISNREEGLRFSVATFDAIAYVSERLMEAGYPFIIEGNFMMGGYMKKNEGDIVKALIQQYGYQSLTFIFHGDAKVMCDRFNSREVLPERGQANQLFSKLTYEDCEKLLPPLGEFTVGGTIIKVDTTDFNNVDFAGQTETARRFLISEEQS